MTLCRHCGEEVTWSRTPNGAMMPVQLDAVGDLVLVDEGDTHQTCRRHRPDLLAEHRGPIARYTAHADFCSR